MFPTFDVPPQHAETVGARKARKEREDGARRASTSTSNSSSSGRNATASKPTANSSESRTEKTSRFAWFGKAKEGIQEISARPPTRKTDVVPESDPEPEPLPLRSPPPRPPPPPQQQQLYEHSRPLHRVEQNPSFVDQLERFPPPLKSLPSLPPTGALPLPPVGPGSPQDDRKSQYSAFSHGSFRTATTSSDRTTVSGRSVFSSKSAFSEALTEESFEDHRSAYGSNVRLEPVERGSRTGTASRQGDNAAKAALAPFNRALAKMENAGSRIISARLSEEWEGLDDDESFEEVIFEKRLWALTAYQRLTQNKHLQSPAHELLAHSRPADQRRILNLHGSLADGWMLAANYPAATVYTVSSAKNSRPPTTYPAPLNHHSLYLPSASSASPFPNEYFDAIVSRTVATILRNDEWARSFFDCMRTLKPGGQIEVLSIDPHMSSEGSQTALWVDEHLTCRLEAHGLSRQASDTVLDTMEIVGLDNIRRARVALPAHSPKAAARAAPPPSHNMPAPSPQDTMDTSRMMALLGRHFYQDLYGSFVHASQGEEWFWGRKDLRDECERYRTKMVLTIACALKPSAPLSTETFLDV
ncbi:hypothetical protein BS50DRAFT_545644 [Corynespora cassiicola Philippines]|uniref:Methyltransferase type 11 domain-containing protein n=1 Tax=Corynespora cassiicola Philippines TaxID=1448308 RepID=A0A2T2NZ82_CORCC|nr:hypothetical protein BS50DRAFT_545644 [Corynespora cassiicola Philippines]